MMQSKGMPSQEGKDALPATIDQSPVIHMAVYLTGQILAQWQMALAVLVFVIFNALGFGLATCLSFAGACYVPLGFVRLFLMRMALNSVVDELQGDSEDE